MTMPKFVLMVLWIVGTILVLFLAIFGLMLQFMSEIVAFVLIGIFGFSVACLMGLLLFCDEPDSSVSDRKRLK